MIILSVCLFITVTARSQRYPFHNLSVDDGLLQSQATCLAQDKAGNLWIGTLGGLSRYDGMAFTNYTVRNGLLNNVVWAVAVDTQGNIWIGGQSGLSQFNGKKFVHYPKPQQSPPAINNTQQIQTVNDTIWWRVQGAVYFVTKGKIKYFVTPGPTGFVSSMLAEKEGLWIAKEGVIYHLYSNKVDTLKFTVPSDQMPPGIRTIFRDRDGMIWITTSIGLYKIDHGSLVPYTINEMPIPFLSEALSVTQDKTGSLWFGTTNGVVKVSDNTVQYYNKHNSLSDNAFPDMLTDAAGNVWMASDGQGIFRFSGTLFSGLDESTGLPGAQIMSIACNYKDSLFLGTYDAGLYIFKDGKVSTLSFPTNPVPAITCLCYTHNSKLWIGTHSRGLWSYENDIFRQYTAPDRNFPSNQINSLYEDPGHRLWIGFANGAMVLEHDSFKTVMTDKSPVYSFLSIGDNKVLIATENGLLQYNAGDTSKFKTNTILDSSSVHVQCFILSGKYLWTGSSDNGVIRYNMETGKALVINKSNGLRSDCIYNIIADNDGNIWVGTGFGIHKIRMNEQDEPQITFYGKEQGITGMESNINSVLKLPDGSIWFGTTNGALHYQPHTTVVSSSPASITLRSVKLAGENTIARSYYDSTDNWYGVPYNLRLPYKKNNISFTFQAIMLSGVQQALYRYRMEGLDAQWSDWSATNSVSYSALPPGKYVFHVQCKGAEGQKSPELAYAFEIIAPFQNANWFRYAVLIACILSGILLQYIVSSRKQRRLRRLEKLRAEDQCKIRMRTAEDFHDEIGNKLTRINMLASVLKNKATLTPDAGIPRQIEDNTAQLYSEAGDMLWLLNPSNDNLYGILHHIRDFGGELFRDTDINFTFSGTDEKWRNHRLAMDMSRNLIMIFKEALNNCLKYSKAKNVSLEVHLKNRDVLQMVLKDDGVGFDVHSIKKGNGINNMNIRAGRLNGKLYIDSRKDKGTIINLTFKVPLNPNPKVRFVL
ncbi:MAG: two-component regulator propeller domain-containing protein [Chitinophagales bacterium]